jgi:hypothetical protein
MAKPKCKWNKNRTICYHVNGMSCQIAKRRSGMPKNKRWAVRLNVGPREKVVFAATKATAQKRCQRWR